MDGENHTLFDGLPGFEMSREELKRERKREWHCNRRADPAYREREREWNRKRRADPAYRERERELERNRRADPAYREQRREREREWSRKRRADPAYLKRRRDQNRKGKFGITPSDYQDFLQKQKGVCAICERPEKSKVRGVTRSLAVDHCHETEEAHGMKFAVRGLLCSECNKVLARATAQRGWFKKAFQYIAAFEKRLELKLMAAGIEHDPFA